MSDQITKQNRAAQVVEMLPPEPDVRALNAVSHGLTAEHVPPEERDAYAQHAQQIREATGASNYLEQRLAGDDRRAARREVEELAAKFRLSSGRGVSA